MILSVGTQASSSSNKKRGVVTGKRTAAIVRASGKTRVTYDPVVAGPPQDVRSRLVTDLSAFIKDRTPMSYATFGELPLSERMTLFDYLSVSFFFLLNFFFCLTKCSFYLY